MNQQDQNEVAFPGEGGATEGTLLDIQELVAEDMQCNCSFKPVCGTDNITYNNECTLQQAAQQYATYAVVKYKGRCRG